jgi:hypothetical protein
LKNENENENGIAIRKCEMKINARKRCYTKTLIEKSIEEFKGF